MKSDAVTGIPGKKIALRTHMLAQRGRAGDLSAAAVDLRVRLRRLPELATAEVVLGYAATPVEVSVDGALEDLRAAGVTVCLPWVAGDDLGVAVVVDSAELVAGWRGVREPPAARRRAVRPAQVDLVLVPGVAFDAHGRRLGHGGGHFDRLLARLRRGAVTVGICLDAQVVDEVPTEPHDRPVDVVVTPTRTLRPGCADGV